MGQKYDDALARFVRDWGDPDDPEEIEKCDAAFADTFGGQHAKFLDACDDFTNTLKATRLGRVALWLSAKINRTGKDI